MANIPLIIYDVNNKTLGQNFVANTNMFFLRSYMTFPIKVISGDCMIYSAVVELPGRAKTLTTPVINKSTDFHGGETNSSYTLFLKSDSIIQCGTNQYHVKLDLDNVFTEELDDDKEWVNSHYNYLLTNYYLPTWKELVPAWFGDDKREIIKRMLLDFRRIINMKGTIESIRLFFKFIELSGIKVFEEYAHEGKNGEIYKTIEPDKLTDWKTGDYHVFLDNWSQAEGNDGLDRKNMPIRKLLYTDMKSFFDKLVYAIMIADKYFTLPEQDISFFGLRYSSNAHFFPGVTTSPSQIFYDDLCHFRKSVNIDLLNHHTENDITYLVENMHQVKLDTELTEVKFISHDYDRAKSLYFVEREVYDDEVCDNPDDLRCLRSVFGNVLHLDVKAPNLYVQVTIKHSLDPDTSITYDKALVDDTLSLIFVTTVVGLFDVVIEIWDGHGNKEKYFYQYNIDVDVKKIDFETFNSTYVGKDPINNIILGVSSPAFYPLNFNDFLNYVLYQNDVPDDLQDYYDAEHEKLDKARHYLTNERYLLPDLNRNFVLDDITETLPVEFLESWIDVYAFKMDSAVKRLYLKVYDGAYCKHILIPYDKIKEHVSYNVDKLFVCLLDIYENLESYINGDLPIPYILVTTTEIGLDVKTLYDLCWCYNDDALVLPDKDYYDLDEFDHVDSVYEDEDEQLYSRVPANFDYMLYIKETNASTIYPFFLNHVSNADADGKTLVKTLFPRLVNIEEAGKYSNVSPYMVKMGDVVECRVNKNYITGETDNSWEVRNAFNGQLLYSTTDQELKYRVEDNLIYTVIFRFRISGELHEIVKESLFSSMGSIELD